MSDISGLRVKLAQREVGGTDKLALLRGHLLFGQLPQAALEHLSSYMKRRSLPRGAVIFTKGDPGTGLMGVLPVS